MSSPRTASTGRTDENLLCLSDNFNNMMALDDQQLHHHHQEERRGDAETQRVLGEEQVGPAASFVDHKEGGVDPPPSWGDIYAPHTEKDSLILHESMESAADRDDQHHRTNGLRIRTTDLSVESAGGQHDSSLVSYEGASGVVVPGTTSTRTSSSTPRFQFEDKTAQEWNQLQENSIQRRRDFQNSSHSLYRRMANFTGQTALEHLAREKALESTMDQFYRQRKDLVDRIMLKQDVVAQVTTVEADRRANQLDVQMTQSVYIALHDRVQDKLGMLQDQVTASARWQWAMAERSRRDARTFRELDSLAGSMARRYHEERASRLAAIELAGYQIQDQEFQPDDVQHVIGAIRELRSQVAWERQERIQRDAALKEAILRETNALKRTILQIAGDDPIFEAKGSGGATTGTPARTDDQLTTTVAENGST